jgi:hypothetical protein
MKKVITMLFLIIVAAPAAFAQNTSIQYTPVQPPNPCRQVPAYYNTSSFPRPGMPNSGTQGINFHGPKRKRKSHVVISEPIIYLAEPDLKNKPKVD